MTATTNNSQPKDLTEGVSLLPSNEQMNEHNTRSRNRGGTTPTSSNGNSTSTTTATTTSNSSATSNRSNTNTTASSSSQPSPPPPPMLQQGGGPTHQQMHQMHQMHQQQQHGYPQSFLRVPQQRRHPSARSPDQAQMMQMQGTDGEGGMLAPYMASPNVSFSPWMVPVDGFRMSPMAQIMPAINGLPMQGRGPAVIYTHSSERNKFETSFLEQINPEDQSSPPNGTGALQVPRSMMAQQHGRNSNSSSNEAFTAMVAHGRLLQQTQSNASSTSSSSSSSTIVKKTSKASAGKAKQTSPKKKRNTINEEERKEKRREQNRRNAAKCRQRKIDKVAELSSVLASLVDENQQLRRSHDELEEKLHRWQAKSIAT